MGYQVKVTNKGEAPVTRLGFTWEPKESKEVMVDNERGLLSLNACPSLEVGKPKEVKDSPPAETTTAKGKGKSKDSGVA